MDELLFAPDGELVVGLGFRLVEELAPVLEGDDGPVFVGELGWELELSCGEESWSVVDSPSVPVESKASDADTAFRFGTPLRFALCSSLDGFVHVVVVPLDAANFFLAALMLAGRKESKS